MSFCEKYGKAADAIDNNKYALEELKKKYKNKYSVMQFSWESVKDILSNASGLYALYNWKNELIYIGKSRNLFKRIPSSIKDRGHQGQLVVGAKYFIIDNAADLDILELLYIQKYNPPCNIDCNGKNSMFNSVAEQYADISLFQTIPKV